LVVKEHKLATTLHTFSAALHVLHHIIKHCKIRADINSVNILLASSVVRYVTISFTQVSKWVRAFVFGAGIA